MNTAENDFYWTEAEIAEIRARGPMPPLVFNRIKPQLELLRRAPAPGESELMHEAPHYPYLIEKKGGA